MPFSSLFCCSSNAIKRAHSEDEPSPQQDTKSTENVVPSPSIQARASSSTLPPPQVPPVPATSRPQPNGTTKEPKASVPEKIEPYTPQRSLALFQKYADKDDPEVIGPEGFEELCTEANIPMDGALPLIFAWQMESKDMGKITKSEWVKGTGNLKIASLPALSSALNDLQNLIIFQQGPLKKSSSKKDDPYDRTSYFTYADDPKKAFNQLYSFCFLLAKEEQSRNIEMEVSCAMWSVLLASQYPIINEVLEFINTQHEEKPGTYKATNKDLWSMMLEFCRTVKPTLQDYEADGAWPTLLDDFVSWKKSKQETN